MKVILEIDTKDNMKKNAKWHYAHNENWKNKSRPRADEVALAMRNECISWLDDLDIGLSVSIIDTSKDKKMVSKSAEWNNRYGIKTLTDEYLKLKRKAVKDKKKKIRSVS